jgi:catabolite repression protein CreC
MSCGILKVQTLRFRSAKVCGFVGELSLLRMLTSSYLGTYSLRDEIHLATPAAHPSEGTAPTTNPLATIPIAPSTGIKLSLVTLNPRATPQLYQLNSNNPTSSGRRTYSIRESDQEGRSSAELGSDPAARTSTEGSSASAPAFGEGNVASRAIPPSSRASFLTMP